MKYIFTYRENPVSGGMTAEIFYAKADADAREYVNDFPERMAKIKEHCISRHQILSLFKEKEEGSNKFVEISW